MKVTLLLADSAQAAEGKLYVLGGGWSITGPEPTPSAIAILVSVPWDQANRRHTFLLELLDGDGQAIHNPEGEPIRVEGGFEVGRPPGLKPGSDLDVPLAVQFGPLPLEADSQFVWKFSVNGASEDIWRLPFRTRPR